MLSPAVRVCKSSFSGGIEQLQVGLIWVGLDTYNHGTSTDLVATSNFRQGETQEQAPLGPQEAATYKGLRCCLMLPI